MFRTLSYLYLTRLLSLLLMVLTLGAMGGGAYSIWRARHDTLDQRLQEAQMQARMFEDQLTQMLNLTHMTLEGVADNFDPKAPSAEVNESLSQTVRRLAFLRSISCVSSDRIWASSAPSNVGLIYQDEDLLPPRNQSEIASFLRIGQPRVGRDLSEGVLRKRQRVPADALGFFPVVREESWHGQRLRFVGVINPDYFVNAMAAHINPQLTRVDVVRYDGVLLFSTDESSRALERPISSEWLRRMQDEEMGVDSQEMLAFRASRSLPFFVVIRIDAQQALADWRIRSQRIGGLAALALLMLWGVGGLLMQRLKKNLADEQSLQEARTLAARVFEASSNGILITDGQCRIVAINAKFEESTGLGRTDVVGMDLHDYLSNAQGHEACVLIEDALNRTDVWRGEISDHKPNGDRIHHWLTLSVVRNAEGEPINYVGVFEDLTQERKRDGQIRRLSQAIEQSPTSIVITDTDAVIEYVNPHFLSSTGYAQEEVLRRKPDFLGSGLTAPETFQSMWRTLKNGQTWEGELINRHRDGQISYQRAIISPIRDAQGQITGYAAVELDVTEQRLQAQQLERARLAAESASVAKSNFLANMSHEIRTPMNGIIGVSELMLALPQDAQMHEYVQTIRNSAKGLLGIINDILDFSKIEANKLQLESLPFSLNDLVSDLLSLMRPAAQERALVLTSEVKPENLPVLMGDASRIRQILLNLLGNAIKFTSEGEVRIEVDAERTSAQKAQIHFHVRDTGIGMPAQVIHSLFSPFYQGDASMTRRFGGTGLGLSISHRLAKLMGGELQVQSVVGQGSVFTLRLSLDLAPQDQVQRVTEPATELPVGLNVLLVEDNPVNRKVARALLGRLQCQVHSVHDGAQALAYLVDHRVDLILMDCQMPIMDGFEATRRIRLGESGEAAQATRIIAMTAHAMQGDREACLAAGMNDYVAKPVTLDELRRVMWRQIRPIPSMPATPQAIP